MAHVVSDNNGNSTFHTSLPFMDPLTHSVIKETSKNLRYYIDVKRRENAFVLNPNSSAFDSIPLKSRLMYGTAKEYPPLYASVYSDNDIKGYLRSFQHQQREPFSTTDSPEKQMCREELNYHMRTQKYSPRENQKFGDLHLRPSTRSSSSCSRITNRDGQKRVTKSAYKISRREQNQLIDATADLLASMVKNRQNLYQAYYLSQQVPSIDDPHDPNPSPRQTDDPSNLQSLSTSSNALKLLKEFEQSPRQKFTADRILEKAASIMQNAKLITKGLLCDYKVSITTGNCNGASTNATIRIKFYGTHGCTQFYNLVNSETHRVPFLKGQTDTFIVRIDHVGQLVGITIGHDEKDIRAGWFLSRVTIDDPFRELTYEIPCNAWLSSKANDQKTIRDFQVTSMISHKKPSTLSEHRRELNSQLGSHSPSPDGVTTRSSITNLSQNDRLTSGKQTKRSQKQRVSIGPTTVVKKTSSQLSMRTQSITSTAAPASPKPATTFEAHFNPNEFASSAVSTRRTYSPKISISSDTDGENNTVNGHRSPTSNQLRKRSISEHNTTPTNDHRPPARLEKRQSSVSASPERTIKNKNGTNDNEAFSFFD